MAQYLRYVIKNVEPIRIADDSTSQSGQTVSLKYIPGTTIRGLVISRLAMKEGFEAIKKILFSDKVRYLNAYLMAGEKELIPSPKGFYEDKVQVAGKKEIQNVVINGEFTEGWKRAALGRFCHMEEDCIYYYNVDTGSDMKIKINLKEEENQSVFRNEYMMPGHIFVGYIAVDSVEVREGIKKVFGESIIIGNARSAGLGKCQVMCCEYTECLPYEEYMPTQSQNGSCYMMLMSNTAMRNANGEMCGINIEKLQEYLGVENLTIKYCATSTVNVKGYNRTWAAKLPSVVMYEQGSVFHLEYSGDLSVERMRELCDKGIGIRGNEGFGRVLFLKDYEKVTKKIQTNYPKSVEQESGIIKQQEDEQVLLHIAKCYYRNKLQKEMERYIVQHPEILISDSGSDSQLGVILSLLSINKYQPYKGMEALKQHLAHAMDKENKQNTQKQRRSIHNLQVLVNDIFKKDIEDVLEVEKKAIIMGIGREELLSDEEELDLKLALLANMIRYKFKEGGK